MTLQFQLSFREIYEWKHYCSEFELEYYISNNELCNSIHQHLIDYQFPEDVLAGDGKKHSRIPSYLLVQKLFHNGFDESYPIDHLQPVISDRLDALVVYPKTRQQFVATNPHIDIQFLRMEKYSNNDILSVPNYLSYIPPFLRQQQVILIYQSLGTYTGGTLALELLHERLNKLGFVSVLCGSQFSDKRCLYPTGSKIIQSF